MLGGPGDQLAHRRGLRRLQAQRGAVLALIAGAPQVKDHGPRHRQRHVGAQIVFDQGQRQIHPRGDAGRGDDLSVAHPDAIGLDVQAGKFAGQLLGAAPMGGDAAAVEQTGLGQQEGPRANRAQPANPRSHSPQPAQKPPIAEQRPHAQAADDQQRVDWAAQLLPGDVRQEPKP
jgi:hypothetical protein